MSKVEILARFQPLFAGTGGIDSWLCEQTPDEIFARLSELQSEPLTQASLNQLLTLNHEAAVSRGFFQYYWLAGTTFVQELAPANTTAKMGAITRSVTIGRLVILLFSRLSIYQIISTCAAATVADRAYRRNESLLPGAASSAELAEVEALLGEALGWIKNGWEAFRPKPKSRPAADVLPETRQDGSGAPRSDANRRCRRRPDTAACRARKCQ
jgi:hypothetical protein